MEKLDTVMVACPTYIGKSYSLEAYISAYNNFIYPHRSLFMVDNTGTGLRYFKHLQSLNIPCEHVDPTGNFNNTFTMSWKKISEEATNRGVDWVMSIEADNICPPLTIDSLLNVAGYCKAVHVAHSYPWHGTQSKIGRLIGLGCNLIHTDVLTAIFAQEKWFTNAVESEVFEYPKIVGAPTVELHNLLTIEHLDDTIGAEQFIFKRGSIPEMGEIADELKPPVYNKDITIETTIT